MEYVLSELCEQVVTSRAAQRPLMLRGGGTRLFYGGALPADDRFSWLDLSAYKGVITYEPSELVITARAGTPLSEIESTLLAQGQMLAFEPPRFGAAGTLGGCVASGLSGPRRMAVGGVADFVLGTRMLDANGNVLRFGGEVMKNVAGYDLSRLLAGSLGVLGAMIELSVKVLPRPRMEQTLVRAATEAEALALCLQWRSQPLPVSATLWQPDAAGEGGRLMVRLSGNESAVRLARQALGGEVLDESAAEVLWLSVRDQTHAFFQQRPLWRIVLPVDAPALGLKPVLHEWGGCLRWLPGDRDAEALRSRVQLLGGSATLYRHQALPAGFSVFHPLANGMMQLHKRLKHEFDPAGIFNPRRLYPEF